VSVLVTRLNFAILPGLLAPGVLAANRLPRITNSQIGSLMQLLKQRLGDGRPRYIYGD